MSKHVYCLKLASFTNLGAIHFICSSIVETLKQNATTKRGSNLSDNSRYLWFTAVLYVTPPVRFHGISGAKYTY